MYRPACANRRADEDVVVSVLSQGVPLYDVLNSLTIFRNWVFLAGLV